MQIPQVYHFRLRIKSKLQNYLKIAKKVRLIAKIKNNDDVKRLQNLPDQV